MGRGGGDTLWCGVVVPGNPSALPHTCTARTPVEVQIQAWRRGVVRRGTGVDVGRQCLLVHPFTCSCASMWVGVRTSHTSSSAACTAKTSSSTPSRFSMPGTDCQPVNIAHTHAHSCTCGGHFSEPTPALQLAVHVAVVCWRTSLRRLASCLAHACGSLVVVVGACSGGTLYLGIDDDGVVRGLRLSRKRRDELRLLVRCPLTARLPRSGSCLPDTAVRGTPCLRFCPSLRCLRFALGPQVDRLLCHDVVPPVPAELVALAFVPVVDGGGLLLVVPSLPRLVGSTCAHCATSPAPFLARAACCVCVVRVCVAVRVGLRALRAPGHADLVVVEVRVKLPSDVPVQGAEGQAATGDASGRMVASPRASPSAQGTSAAASGVPAASGMPSPVAADAYLKRAFVARRGNILFCRRQVSGATSPACCRGSSCGGLTVGCGATAWAPLHTGIGGNHRHVLWPAGVVRLPAPASGGAPAAAGTIA